MTNDAFGFGMRVARVGDDMRQRKRPRGALLRAYRLDCEEATLLQDKSPRAAEGIIARGQSRIMNTLLRDHGAKKVLRHGGWITRAMENVERGENAPLFRGTNG